MRLVFGIVLTGLIASGAKAQGVTVAPVNITLAPGQMVTSLTVGNQTGAVNSFQFRGFVWTQQDGADRLQPTQDLLVSPPISTVANGSTQVVRVLLRRPPQGKEASYRILIDQIPPPAAPGTVRIALRLSIPVFAEPATRVFARVAWEVQMSGGKAWLVGVNHGSLHETVRDIALAAPGRKALAVQANVSPYILPGATRRWPIVAHGAALAPGETLHLTARLNTGKIDQPVRVVTASD